MNNTKTVVVTVTELTMGCFIELCDLGFDYQTEEFGHACRSLGQQAIAEGNFLRARGFALCRELADYLTSWNQLCHFRYGNNVVDFRTFADSLNQRLQQQNQTAGGYVAVPLDPFDAMIQEWSFNQVWLDPE